MKSIYFVALAIGMAVMFSCQQREGSKKESKDDQLIGVIDSENISDELLEKFIAALMEVQLLDEESQQQMYDAVENGALGMERFNEIHMAQSNPELEIGVTDKEMSDFNAAMAILEQIQVDVEEKMIEQIEQQGISLEVYQQIIMALQTDPALMQRFQQMIQQVSQF